LVLFSPSPEEPMFAFLLTLLIIDAVFLSIVVLLQAGQGGGLASLGGGGGTAEGLVGGRQAVTLLTRATWWCGGIFLVLSLGLSFTHRGDSAGDLQKKLRTGAAPIPSAATLPIETGKPAASAPAAAAPAATAPTPTPAAPKK
jgi:preprotein translocase subunit SecG